MSVSLFARLPRGNGRLMNENHQGNYPGPAPVALPPRSRGGAASPPRAAKAQSDLPALTALRTPNGSTVTNVSRTAPAGSAAPRAVPEGNGRPPDAAPKPPTLATQLNNGDIAGRAAAPRPRVPLPLTPAAGPSSGGQPGAGSGRGGARA